MVLGNAGLSDDVPFVDEESRSSGGCLVPVLHDCPAVQAHLRGAYTYFETAVRLVGGALPDEMNPFCSPWWEVFSGNAATALGAFVGRPVGAPRPLPWCSPLALPVP